MTRQDTFIIAGIGFALIATSIACSQYNVVKERQLREKKVENDKLYFEKLTPEQVERLEHEKLELKKKEIELRQSEDELKKTVTNFEESIKAEIERKTMTSIHDDIRNTFDTWATKYEDRLDKKIDRVVNRIDDLSDKYGGVKAGSSAPSINVVNAPNG